MSRILFIGSGQMSEAMIRALIQNKVYQATHIFANDISQSRLSYLQQTYGVTPTTEIIEADIIVIGVRPQDPWSDILAQIKSSNPNTIIISIITGVSIAKIKQALTIALPVVRTIPNTLTDTGYGYSGVATDSKDKAIAQQPAVIAFFNGFGKIEHISESLLDIFTGYGVAGPNYVYYFYESLVDAGVLAGLPREIAKRLAIENLHGAASMLILTQKHPRELLDINNSPAGVGMHVLYELNNSDFAAGLQRSVQSAIKRTGELGRIINSQ